MVWVTVETRVCDKGDKGVFEDAWDEFTGWRHFEVGRWVPSQLVWKETDTFRQ